jgi:hypothetical protein
MNGLTAGNGSRVSSVVHSAVERSLDEIPFSGLRRDLLNYGAAVTVGL